ncbi:MAG: hypothetical protein E7464_01865 [Ruminococcaceae bacterium]|nr:hypothetical protein [Oscillospiraceae bacterium]
MNEESAYLGRPVRSLQTMLRLISIVVPEISPVIPDGVYGMSTMRSVTALQRYLRLPATGVVDLATWNEIIALYYDAVEELLSPQALEIFLQPGQRIVPGEENQHIHLVQAIFRSIGTMVDEVPPVELNGRNDEATTRAIIWLQQSADLPATGELDRRTWRYLVGLYRLIAFDGKSSNNQYPR